MAANPPQPQVGVLLQGLGSLQDNLQNLSHSHNAQADSHHAQADSHHAQADSLDAAVHTIHTFSEQAQLLPNIPALQNGANIVQAINNLQQNMTLQLNVINNRLNIIDNRLDGIDNRLDGIDNRLDGIDNRLDGIDNRLDGIDNRLDQGDQMMRWFFEAVPIQAFNASSNGPLIAVPPMPNHPPYAQGSFPIDLYQLSHLTHEACNDIAPAYGIAFAAHETVINKRRIIGRIIGRTIS